MKKMLLDTKVDGGTKSVWAATLETFGMADGHHHKDDIVVDVTENGGASDDGGGKNSSSNNNEASLELLREYAKSQVEAGKYDWDLVPFEGFNKNAASRDDLLMSFLKWAEKEVQEEEQEEEDDAAVMMDDGGGSDAPPSTSSSSTTKTKTKRMSSFFRRGSSSKDSNTTTKKTGRKVLVTKRKCNVSKAARRLDAYFQWMEDNKHEIYGVGGAKTKEETDTDTDGNGGDDKNMKTKAVNEQEQRRPLTFQSIEAAAKIWDIQITYDEDQKFVWWIDLGKLMVEDGDGKKKNNIIKSLDPNEHLRYVVWFAHLVMFDEHARENGAIIVEDMAHIGFWKLATLLPHELSVKMDRLTIGILPVKMKAIYVFGAAGWMHLLMNLMKPFMSKKMRDRMKLVSTTKTKEDMQTFCENLVGGKANIPSGFCGLDGDAKRDSAIEQFIM